MSQVYKGSSRRLVLAFDVGTTYSGISYCLLDPGETPRICTVTRYPGQEHAAGTSKIPSIIYYDRLGKARAAGAEVHLANNVEQAEDEEWIKVEWFKVRMRPKSMPSKLKTSYLPPLPPNKTVVQVVGDLLAYLMGCAERFIRDTHPPVSSNGSWEVLRNTATFVLGHPNGWEGPQQTKLRQAAIMAKLVPDSLEGRSRVTFVSEGEASLHYCLREGLLDVANKGFIIADLGGGTLDFSAYKVTGTKPLQVEEIAAARCELEGSTFVTRRAVGFLKGKLTGSIYGSDEHIKQIAERFDETAKKTFRSASDVCLIPFGSTMDKDPAYGIRSGKLKLSGEEVAAFFEASVVAATSMILGHIKDSPIKISSVYLVGGFSANPYLISQLREKLANTRITITSPDGQTSKTVSDGAISFYLDHYVSARVAKMTYGVLGSRWYDSDDPEHRRRITKRWKRPSGEEMVGGAFFAILKKGTSVSEEKEFREDFSQEATDPRLVDKVKFAISAYRGPGAPPEWEDQITDKSLLKKLFFVSADVSALKGILQPRISSNGTKYWKYEYDLVIYFGGPEIRAQIVWLENGVKRRQVTGLSNWEILQLKKKCRGPAQVLYDVLDEDSDENESEDEWVPVPALDRLRL